MTIDDYPDELVCPRCGVEVGESAAFCRSCGLNLQIQDELPTSEMYATSLRAGERPAFKGAKPERQAPEAGLVAGAIALLVLTGVVIGALIVSAGGDDAHLVDPASLASTRSADGGRSGAGAAGPYAVQGKTSGSAIVESVIERHWKSIEEDRLSDAYADFSKSFRANPAVGSKSKWIAGQRDDPLQSVSVSVRAAKVGPRSAKVEVVKLRTESEKSGCKQWSGTYEMVREGARWVIDAAPLKSTSC